MFESSATASLGLFDVTRRDDCRWRFVAEFHAIQTDAAAVRDSKKARFSSLGVADTRRPVQMSFSTKFLRRLSVTVSVIL